MQKNKTKIKIMTFWVVMMLLSMISKVEAQRTLIDVRMDSSAILIGEQTKLSYTLTTDKEGGAVMLLPVDTLMKGVEIVSVSKPDSSIIENDRLQVKQDLLITSFDSSLYLLPPLMAVQGNDTIYGKQVALKVSTVPVKADKPNEFNDIKSIWEAPFVWADYYPLMGGLLGLLLLLALAYYLYKRWKNKKSLLPSFKAEEPILPPHEQALKELNALKERKLWQQGKDKEYYTILTEILRKYIDERFDVNAMESTSAEILDVLKKNKEVASVYDGLRDVLVVSDFVKFAKMKPMPDENDRSMNFAFYFIDETTVVEEPEDEEVEAKASTVSAGLKTNVEKVEPKEGKE